MTREEVEQAVTNLRDVLKYATAEEKRAIVQENVSEIIVYQDKSRGALLITNLEGPLTSLGCFFLLVTPRGVHKKVPKVKARPESIYKLDLDRIDLRTKANR